LKRSNNQTITSEMRDAFDALSTEEKNLIFRHIYLCSGSPQTTDLQWGEHHVFDDSEIFARAVLYAGLDKFDHLSLDAKNKVCGIVYQKAGNLTCLFEALSSL